MPTMQDDNPFISLTDFLLNLSDETKTLTFIEGAQESERISFIELRDHALRLLSGFRAKGVKAGHEVVIYIDDNKSFLTAFWACLFGAMIPVPVAAGPHREHQQKLFKILQKLDHAFLFSSDNALQPVRVFAAEEDIRFPLQERLLLATDMQNEAAQAHADAGLARNLAFIQYSSGSTRDPKGVMLTHANLVSNIKAIRKAATYQANDKFLSWMPLTHDMGLIGMHLSAFYSGIDQCFMPPALFSRRPILWLKKASEEACTILCSPNFGYKHLLKAIGDKTPDDIDLSKIRVIFNGAEPISVDLSEQFLDRFQPCGLRRNTMYFVYGLAEASLAVSFPPIGSISRAVTVDRGSLSIGEQVRMAQAGDAGAVRFAVVGKAIESCEIRLVLNGKSVPAGMVGEVHIRGASITQGFYRDAGTTASTIDADGWLNTGDLGFMWEGELVITGRAKEIIFANGQNFYPQDLEAVIQQETGIELGRVATSAAHRDDTQTEELIVFIVHRGGLDSFKPITAKVTKALSEILGLEAHHVLPVRTIPKTTSGKIQRGLLAKAYLAGEYNESIAALNPAPRTDKSNADTQDPVLANVMQICKKIAPNKTIGPKDDIFEKGLSSLQLTEMHEQIDGIYPNVVDFTDMFGFATLNDVAGFIREKLNAK